MPQSNQRRRAGHFYPVKSRSMAVIPGAPANRGKPCFLLHRYLRKFRVYLWHAYYLRGLCRLRRPLLHRYLRKLRVYLRSAYHLRSYRRLRRPLLHQRMFCRTNLLFRRIHPELYPRCRWLLLLGGRLTVLLRVLGRRLHYGMYFMHLP